MTKNLVAYRLLVSLRSQRAMHPGQNWVFNNVFDYSWIVYCLPSDNSLITRNVLSFDAFFSLPFHRPKAQDVTRQ